MALRMTITEDRNVVTVALAARIDSFAIEELYEGFEQVKKTGKRNIALMMRDLEYINSRASQPSYPFSSGPRSKAGPSNWPRCRKTSWPS